MEPRPEFFKLLWGILAVFLFGIDLVLPEGTIDGFFYVILVLAALRIRNKNFLIMATLLATLLNMIGFYLALGGPNLYQELLDRLGSTLTIWLVGWLCLIQQKSEDHAYQMLQRQSSFVQLHKDIAVASNETRAVDVTLQYCLKRICHQAGWPVGHLYLVDASTHPHLVSTTTWHLENPQQFQTFRMVSEGTVFDSGIGLPGRVLANGKPAWIIDVNKDPNFPRARLSPDIGVKAGFAFPILIGNEVAGIMEFFSPRAEPPNDDMLEVMGHIGTLLGRVLERKRAESEQEQLLSFLKERVNEQTCLYNVANLIANTKTIREVFNNLQSYIAPAWQFPDITRVKVTFEGEEFAPSDFQDTAWSMSAPLTTHGVQQGSLVVCYLEEKPDLDEGPFRQEERHLLDGLAYLLSVAAQRKLAEEEIERSRQQLRSLYHKLETVREEERSRIAREIHDEMAQVLTTMKLEVARLCKKLEASNPDLKDNAETVIELIDQTLPTVKQLIHDLRPPILDHFGLEEAISWQGQEFERLTGISFDFDCDSEPETLDKERSTTLFRIFQETLTNVARHSKAENVSVKLSDEDGMISLNVQDDGVGITPDRLKNGHSLGILGMQERARVWGGSVDFVSKPNQGTLVSINISRN
ncbi:GAF domain-containing sensor histidine kinase [Nitrospina watsonii]|uniref:Histidine kinase domain-containing protein n=1 Tax=Nitrospina watsonii TaxID=1323948 RepID=A0ABM9HFC7_9BACT|nr:GAF domain-containing sensor histidine kinase [Nitrospina watsonii]CAI2718929.1 Histidine kinase domain-containing protein [Nitrospina watsonii]